MIVDKQLFFEIQKKFASIPFNQTEAWLESTSTNENIIFFLDSKENPQLCCWGRSFKRSFIGEHLLIDGLSTNIYNINLIKKFFQTIVSLDYSIIELSDIGYYNPNFEIGIRQAGFVRPMLSLSPLTLLVKLQEEFSFHRNWRRNVTKAISNGLNFIALEYPTIKDCDIFSTIFNQLKERKDLSFTVESESLYKLLRHKEYKLFFAVLNDNEYMSARVVYITKQIAYDVFAANSNKGIQIGAAYFLQEKILLYLKDNGIEQFDYGRIPPSNNEMNSIYEAKSYSGGKPVQYNGQWIYTKSRNNDLILNLHKFYYCKQRRY